jgi:hypothetical protein
LITQAELEAYRKAKRDAEERESGAKHLRDSLLAREGEEVEPGPLAMSVGLRISRSFSFEALAKILGYGAADDLRGKLPESRSKVLTVTSS